MTHENDSTVGDVILPYGRRGRRLRRMLSINRRSGWKFTPGVFITFYDGEPETRHYGLIARRRAR